MSQSRLTAIIPTLVIMVLTLVYMVTGYQTLDEESRHVPLLTAWLTLFVLVLDVISIWRTEPSALKPPKIDEGVGIRDEVNAVASLIGLVVAVYYLGFYVGGALYLLISLLWTGKQTLRFSVLTTVAAFACIYLLFEKGLAFELFRGVLLSDY